MPKRITNEGNWQTAVMEGTIKIAIKLTKTTTNSRSQPKLWLEHFKVLNYDINSFGFAVFSG